MAGSAHMHMANIDSIQESNSDHCPDSVVEYLARMTELSELSLEERPNKRQRLDSSNDLSHMIVKRSSLALRFREQTQRTKSSLVFRSETARTTIEESGAQVILKIADGAGQGWNILDGIFDVDNVPFRDIKLAAHVSLRIGNKHNPKAHGRLWTETGFDLSVQEGFDILLLTWVVKWNFTPSLAYISATRPERHELNMIIESYYPGLTQNRKILPQDFYNSVFLPTKDDAVAASIKIPKLQAQLYPFQKRAVRWLLGREGVQWSKEEGCVDHTVLKSEKGPIAFYKVVDDDGRTCWISPLFKAVTSDLSLYKEAEDSHMGGLLVEEMGLGKTLEVIALITLHRRHSNSMAKTVDPYAAKDARPIGATLIITPPSILQQWESELASHSPSLKVFHYQGKRKHKKLSNEQLVNKIAEQDVVITTYRVLASEIHHAGRNPDRTLRQSNLSNGAFSVFTYFLWWRCVLDEAQMIEGGATNAVTMAQLVPRINAWGVTGTPVKRDVEDIFGLLKFIRYEPFGTLQWTWNALLSHPLEFQALFQSIALRHTKSQLRDELKLPPQKRYVITMPFTPVEEQHYQSLFEQMCYECGVDLQGAPLTDEWDPNSFRTVERMKNWLSRLRQSALHPEIGVKNRRALGRKAGPLRTVEEVLETMLEQTELAIRGDQRTLLLTRLKMGQCLENSPRVSEALEIWKNVLAEAETAVVLCRQQLQSEIDSYDENQEPDSGVLIADEKDPSSDYDSGDDLEFIVDASTRIGIFRNRLNAALEVQHVAIFYCANAYFQIKSNETMTKPDSEEFKEFERLEMDGYEKAKLVRQEILKEIFEKNTKRMKRLATKASSEDFLSIPEFDTKVQKGGIESRRLFEQLDTLAAMLDAQANQLDEWREVTIQNLLRPLIDEEEVLEMTGEEYEQSTKTQDEVVVWVLALRTVIEDRHDALSGQENQLVKYEVKTALAQAEAGDGPFPQKVLELLRAREELKPPAPLGSIRGIISELRTLSSKLKREVAEGSLRAASELELVERNMKLIHNHLSKQDRAVDALRKEVAEYTSLMNLRVEYYRQLQQISDMVMPLEEERPLNLYKNLAESARKLDAKIATAKSKLRFLVHLQEESTTETEAKECLICQSPFESGSLTVCGHLFCKECIGLWWKAHKNCPACKSKLTLNDLHDVTYKPQELKMAEEEPITPHNQDRAILSASKKSEIYSQISTDTLSQIKNIDLAGPSFTTKVDTLCRHLLWLRQAEPYAKSIVFSQFGEFLEVLSRAFEHHRIGYATIDKANGITKFKEDPSTECFLLHAKSQSSGLNLVNASHVFLCEPLINTAIELQAIARVDRIGQQKATTVWLYLIDGTVEEAIYNISVRRRMEHMGRGSTVTSREGSPELPDRKIEDANSMELQQAPLANLLTKDKTGGEIVDKADLWECLFGNRKPKGQIAAAEEILDREVARHFGAEAAEARIVNGV